MYTHKHTRPHKLTDVSPPPQMCKGPCASGSPGDAPDPDLLGMLGADGLGRLKRLQERLIQPQGILGPCPPPSFPGHEEFFRDFLQTASWSENAS